MAGQELVIYLRENREGVLVWQKEGSRRLSTMKEGHKLVNHWQIEESNSKNH